MKQVLLLSLLSVSVLSFACHYSCNTCTADLSSTACIDCPASSHRTIGSPVKTCLCDSKFYDDGTNAVCKPCREGCLTCTNANECLTCSGSRTLNTGDKTCPCNANYYYVSPTSPDDCVQCHYSCANCSGAGATGCLTCDASKNRTLTSAHACQCNDGLYDNGSTLQCQPCDVSCTTCTNSTTSCSTCSVNNNRDTVVTGGITTCPCKTGFYQDGTNKICKACSYTCQTC